MWDQATYIRMPSQLLDNGLIKVTRISEEASSNVEGVLQSMESFVKERDLRPLPQLEPGALV